MKPLRICLDARSANGAGGVQQVVVGLARALARLTDGDEEYLFLTAANSQDWIQPHMGGPCRLLTGPAQSDYHPPAWRQALRRTLAFAHPLWQRLRYRGDFVTIPRSDGTIERAEVDLMHFTMQSAFLTEVPSIYMPWDLQHLHLPQLFESSQLKVRAVRYPAFCQQAKLVTVASRWGKADLVDRLHLDPAKVAVVPMAALPDGHEEPTAEAVEQVRARFNLPAAFLYFPAQTWPHKNHLVLLQALVRLRSTRGLAITLVCSGVQTEHYDEIKRFVQRHDLGTQVKFLGVVTPGEVQCLYRAARAMVFPTLFEGWGLPIPEAFAAGLPVACSNISFLPDLTAGAALLFDPRQAESLDDAINRLWTDEGLRRTLAEKGRARSRDFSWAHTARIFRAHYRRLAARPLTADDHALLASPALV